MELALWSSALFESVAEQGEECFYEQIEPHPAKRARRAKQAGNSPMSSDGKRLEDVWRNVQPENKRGLNHARCETEPTLIPLSCLTAQP